MNVLVFLAVVATLMLLKVEDPARTRAGMLVWGCGALAAATFWALVIG